MDPQKKSRRLEAMELAAFIGTILMGVLIVLLPLAIMLAPTLGNAQTEPYSIDTYTGTGTQSSYAVTFPYIQETDVEVLLSGVVTTAYTWTSPSQINFATPPAAAAPIVIERHTQLTAPVVVFQPGTLASQDLNTAELQNIYLAQEASDALYLAQLPAIALTAPGNSILAGPNGVTGMATFRSLTGQDLNGIPGVGYSPTVVAGSSVFAATNSTNINAAIQAFGSAGLRGIVQLPCGFVYVASPIINNVPGVMVQGCTGDWYHDAGNNVTYGTTLMATTAMSVLQHFTPSSSTSSTFVGGGFRWMNVNANSLATRLLYVNSVRNGTYDLYLIDSVGSEAAYFTAGVTGTDSAEAADLQGASIHLRVRQLDGTTAEAANGVVFNGSTNANFSMNYDIDLRIQYANGNALVCENADNNFIKLIAIRVSGGTGRNIYGYGIGTTSTFGCNSNMFFQDSGVGASYMRGTSDGDTTGVSNTIVHLDTGNATPTPTSGTGSYWRYFDANEFANVGDAEVREIVADSASASLSARGYQASTTTADFVNGSGDHIRLHDVANTNDWGINIDPSNGDLRFGSFAGGTSVEIPNADFIGSTSFSGTAGVSCTGTPTSSFASTHGIVTHC